MRADPQVIMISDRNAQALKDRPGWDRIRAVRDRPRLRVHAGAGRRAGAPRPAHGRGGAADGATACSGRLKGGRRDSPAVRAPAPLALLLLAATALLCVGGVAVGSLGWEPLWGRGGEASAAILWDIRLPRTLGAWLAGALLGLAGAVAQGLFRNPLADPYLLGSATGAALGVAVLLVLIGVCAGRRVRLGGSAWA